MSIIVDNNTPIFTGLSSISTSNVIFSGGNVGIGTASPAAKLDVNGGTGTAIKISGGGDFEISSQVSGSNSILYNDTGTLNINTPLTVTGIAAATVDLRAPIFYDSANTAYYLDPASTGTSLNVAGAALIAGTLDVTGVGSLPGLKGQKTTAGGGFISSIDEGANVYNVLASRNNANSAYLPLSIRGGTITIATSSDIATFSSSGKVGIGTASPSSTLSVGGNPPAAGAIGAVGASGGISLALSDNVNSSLYVKHAAAGVATLGTDAGGSLAFATNGYTEAIRINSSGLVGIGTTGPVSKLHVAASTPTSLGSLPSGVTAVSDSSTNNYLLFRNTQDNGTYSGIAFQDNNIGGYVIFGNAGGGGDLLYLAGYGGGQLQYGSADSIAPGSRTTVASWSSTGFTTSSPLLPTGGIIGNTINYTTSQGWAAANPTSTQTGYFGGDFTGNGSASENKTTYAVTPYLSPGLTWASINDVGNDADGGWNKSITGLVSTKTYRSMVWVRRTNASTNGNFYFGCDGGNTLNLSNAVETNPYFYATGIGTLTTTNRWYLAVGYIHAYADGSTTSYGKIYDSITGLSILSGTDFKMVNGATAQTHRTYLYYSTDTNSNLEWWGPRFEEVNGNEPTIGSMLAGSITTPTYSGGVSAPIYYDSDNTAFYGDFASTTNINTLAGNGKTALETADTYLRINQSSAFSAGVWFGNSNRLSSSGYGAWGSDGGTTTSRVWILGGTYNGSNVISLNGSTGDITSSAIIYALTSSRSPIFYDYNDTTYYIDPASTANTALKVRGGAIFGPNTSWGASLYVGTDGNVSGTATVAASNGNIHIDTAGSGYPLYLQYYNGGFTNASGSMRSPIFYDLDNTGYYVDPNSSTSLRTAGAWQSDHAGWTGELNKIQWHSTHLYFQNTSGGYLAIFRAAGGAEKLYIDSAGNVTASGNITAYSDRRLKENIETIPNALSMVKRLRGVTFDWIADKKHSYGLIAQEVEEVIPELVLETESGTADGDDKKTVKSVDYSKIVSVLIEAIKEQQSQIEELKLLVQSIAHK